MQAAPLLRDKLLLGLMHATGMRMSERFNEPKFDEILQRDIATRLPSLPSASV